MRSHPHRDWRRIPDGIAFARLRSLVGTLVGEDDAPRHAHMNIEKLFLRIAKEKIHANEFPSPSNICNCTFASVDMSDLFRRNKLSTFLADYL